jgi:hypothetical protein|tara:strand:+ start:98 stop:577 length:480 start_codon:yes stop_codon:yes gene_type:complete
MEETDEGAVPEGTTLAGTPNVAPAGDDGGAYGQPEVQYAKRSVVPVIIGAIYSLAQVLLILLVLVGYYVGLPLTTFDVFMLASSCVGLYAGILMIQYKKRGIHIALGLIAVGFVVNLITGFLMGSPVTDGLVGSLAKWSICAAFVAVPLLVSGISEQME